MKKQTNYIKIIYFLRFFSDAIFAGYLSMYFKQKYSSFSFEYGLLLGVIPFCSLIGNFIWGYLSKSVSKNLILVRIILALESICMVSIILNRDNFILLLISTICFGLFNSPCFTMQDGLSSSYSKKENVKYPSIRYIGSFGYFCALVVGSFLIKLFNNNFNFIFIISIILNLICIILWFFIKPFNEISAEEENKVKFIEVFKNKTFVYYFIAYVLIIGSNSVADSYLFTRFNEVGILESTYSLIFASEILIEVIIMIILNKFLLEKHYVLVLKISVIILFLRSFIFGFNLPLPILIIFAPLRGIGWGGFLSVHLLILRKIVSNKLVTKAISILTIFLSLFNGLMTIFAPSIYKVISLPNFYLLLSSCIFIGIIIIMFMKFDLENKNVN